MRFEIDSSLKSKIVHVRFFLQIILLTQVGKW